MLRKVAQPKLIVLLLPLLLLIYVLLPGLMHSNSKPESQITRIIKRTTYMRPCWTTRDLEAASVLLNDSRPTPEILVKAEAQLCPYVVDEAPYLLAGRLDQSLLDLNESMLQIEVQKLYKMVNDSEAGGAWKPTWCIPRHRVAVIIPYRDRLDHLLRLITYLTPILRRQLLDYRFIVAEQQGNDTFNKGRIMNAAFTVASNMSLDCVVFHDVDIFPQDDRLPYGCPSQPFHMGGRVNTLNYAIWYHNLVGGALAFRMEHYRQVNGYSNQYWGWGGEDDDMGKRILAEKLTITRPDEFIGRYTMLKHEKRSRHPSGIVHKILAEALSRYKIDGLNAKSAWNITKVTAEPIYFHALVDVGPVPKEWRN